MHKGFEKRRYARINKPFIARFKEKDVPGWDIVTLQNLGVGGTIFNYNRKFELGSLIDFKIDFPSGENPVKCTGRVIRVEEPYFPPIFGVATDFTDIDRRTIDLISRTVLKMSSLFRKRFSPSPYEGSHIYK